MISIPLYTFLFIYLLFLVIFFIFSLVNVWHLTHTGALTTASLVITVFVIALTLATFLLTWRILSGTDWRQTITIGNSNRVVTDMID